MEIYIEQRTFADGINFLISFEENCCRLLREAFGEHVPSQGTCERWFRCYESDDFKVADKKFVKTVKKFENVELQTLSDEDV